MTIQEKIKLRRTELGLTQQELAEKLGYKSGSAVNKVEKGIRSISQEMIPIYAAALMTTPEYLTSDTEDVIQENKPIQSEEQNVTENTDTVFCETLQKENDSEEFEKASEQHEVEQTPIHTPVQTTPSTPEKRSHRGIRAAMAVNIVLTLILVCVTVCGIFYIDSIAKSFSGNPSAPANIAEQTVIYKYDTPTYNYSENPDGTLDTVAMLKDVLPSVVYIQTKACSGSGVFLSEDGWIITCAHVIAETTDASEITVMTNDRVEHTATEFHFDTNSDIGVIKITGEFQAAKYGDSEKVVAGEPVVAVGSPLGSDFFQSATKGIVSAVRKSFDFTSLGLILNVVQHDAAINGGNSGGPLFNAYGQVIGINSVKMSSDSGYENMGFAIMSNDALKYAADLITYGKVNRPMIGIKGSTESTVGGILVAEIMKDGSAATSDLQVGDIITKADNVRVKTITQLISYLSDRQNGESVKLTVIRNGTQVEIELTLISSLDIDE